MISFDDLQKDIYLTGFDPDQKTRILSVEPMDGVVHVVGRNDDGSFVDTMVFESDLARYTLADKRLMWSFTADADDYRLVSEAWRIKLAWLFDPMTAVHTSSIEPLPDQITAVYDAMLFV